MSSEGGDTYHTGLYAVNYNSVITVFSVAFISSLLSSPNGALALYDLITFKDQEIPKLTIIVISSNSNIIFIVLLTNVIIKIAYCKALDLV